MSLSLVDVLGAPSDDDPIPLATITKVNADGTVDLALDGGIAEAVAVLNPYVPRAGDPVIVVRRGAGRLLVLGSVRTSNDPTVDVQESLTLAWNVTDSTPTIASPFVVAATQTRSTRGASWDRPEIYQGALVPNSGYWRGLFFYGSAADALRGRTVTRIRIQLSRRNDGGSAGPVPVYIAPHIHPTRPASEPVFTARATQVGTLPRAGSGTFDLPVGWGQALANGTVKGFGTAYDGTADYLILNALTADAGQGTLIVDWT